MAIRNRIEHFRSNVRGVRALGVRARSARILIVFTVVRARSARISIIFTLYRCSCFNYVKSLNYFHIMTRSCFNYVKSLNYFHIMTCSCFNYVKSLTSLTQPQRNHTQQATFECIRNYDVNSTRASCSNTGTAQRALDVRQFEIISRPQQQNEHVSLRVYVVWCSSARIGISIE